MVVGAPQITSQPVFSIFLCFPLLSGTWRTPGLSLMSSSRLFFYLPCVLPPLTVPCKIVLARPDERETCPYLFSLMITSSWLQTHWFWSAQPFYSPKAIKQKKKPWYLSGSVIQNRLQLFEIDSSSLKLSSILLQSKWTVYIVRCDSIGIRFQVSGVIAMVFLRDRREGKGSLIY